MNKMLEPKSLDQLEHEVADWEANEVALVPEEAGRAQAAILHHRRFSGQARLHRRRYRRHADRGYRPARPLPVHARPLSDDVPQPLLDHAPDRRLRHRRGHQQTLQVFDRAGADGPLHRLRYADADGLRLRSPDERRRGRPRRRRRRYARRHGGALRRHRSGENLGLHDHQSERLDPAGDVYRARQKARLRSQQDVRHDPGRHLEGIHGAEGILLSDRALGAHRARLHHLLRRAHEALQPDQYFRLPHFRGRLFAAARSRVHAGQRHRLRRRRC